MKTPSKTAVFTETSRPAGLGHARTTPLASPLRVASLAVIVASAAAVSAQPVSFDPFTRNIPVQGNNPELFVDQLPGGVMDPGATYTTYTVEFDWIPDANFNAASTDAIWALYPEAPSPGGPSPFVDPGPALNIDVATLGGRQIATSPRWTGVLNQPIGGSSDLFFAYTQFSSFTPVTWSNIRITLDNPPLFGSTFSGGTSADSPRWTRPLDRRTDAGPGSPQRQNVPFEVKPFFVDTTGIYQFSSTADGWISAIVFYQDEFDASNSALNLMGHQGIDQTYLNFAPRVAGFEFEAGRQYFMVHTGRTNTQFGTYSGEVTGVGNVTFGVIPEPSTMAALAAVPLLLRLRKRRKAKA